MKINVIGVPLNLGCDREGVERAPNHLRERGLMRIIRKNGRRAFDLGNLYVPLVSEADKFADVDCFIEGDMRPPCVRKRHRWLS